VQAELPRSGVSWTESERELLEDMDLWPDDWSLVSGRVSEWERPDGQVLRAKRVSIRPRYRHGD
jgi:hypothetical protein